MAANVPLSACLGPGCAAALVLGVLACSAASVLLPMWLGVLLVVVALSGWLLRWRGRVVAAAVFGLGWATCHGHAALQQQWPPGAAAQVVQVRGRVVDLPTHASDHTRFTLHVAHADGLPALRGRRLQVRWSALKGAEARNGGVAVEQRHAVRAGAQWQLVLRVRAPRSRINPGGFDGERHALLQGLAGSASVQQQRQPRLLRPAHGLLAWRESCSDAIATQVGRPSARFVQALALGDTHRTTLLSVARTLLRDYPGRTTFGVVLMAATLGGGVDALLRRLELSDIALCTAVDATASAAIEKICDAVEADARAWAADRGLYLTGRYSPGYGDCPLSLQQTLCLALDTPRAMGLTVTPQQLLAPRKSVTAILGAADHPVTGTRAGCGRCLLRETCAYLKRGMTCAT